jgi:hypothetical protein
MGMNYYLRKNDEVGVEQQVHLGKSSMGWTFSFRGDRANGVVDFDSWVKRVNVFMKDGWKLTDEGSGDSDFTELLLFIQRKRLEPNNQTLSAKANPDYYNENISWLDEDNNSFTDREFC